MKMLLTRIREVTWGRLMPGAAVIDLNAPEQSGAEHTASVAGLRVLFIDDNESTRELLAGTLRHYGAEVTVATSAHAALEVLDRTQPQVVITNCVIAPEDTFVLLRKVRAMEAERRRRIPTVAVTAYLGAKNMLGHLTAGFQVHVHTLPEPRDLVSIVGRLAAAGSL